MEKEIEKKGVWMKKYVRDVGIALNEIYKIWVFLHHSDINISANIA